MTTATAVGMYIHSTRTKPALKTKTNIQRMFVSSISLFLSFFVSSCFHAFVMGCDLQVWNLTRLNEHNHLLVSKTKSQETKTFISQYKGRGELK
jgi:hypothetical protein